MDFMVEPKLNRLNFKIDETRKYLDDKINSNEQALLTIVNSIKSDITKEVANTITKFNSTNKKLNESLTNQVKEANALTDRVESKYDRLSLDIREQLDSKSKQLAIKQHVLDDSIADIERKINKSRLLFEDIQNNLIIKYIDANGQITQRAITKVLVDDKTIKMDYAGRLYCDYKFDLGCFDIDSDNKIIANKLSLGDGKYISSSRINNDLNNATYNISSLTYKLEKVLEKINSINIYAAANDFKTSNPSREALTKFTLSCFAASGHEVDESDIPVGTKVKNLFDNHIWILNRIKTKDGLTQIKWEDFGSDNICIAGNTGTLGLVCGSQDRFRGYIDVNGTISINGLQEEFNNLITSIKTIAIDVNQYKLQIENQLHEFDARIKALEKSK